MLFQRHLYPHVHHSERPEVAEFLNEVGESELMPMTHAPETGARKLASVSGASVIQSGARFVWRQILESDRTVFCFTTESGDHAIKILICDWSVFNVVAVFVCWSCKFCLYFTLFKLFNLFNLFSLFNMSWTDSQIESLITVVFIRAMIFCMILRRLTITTGRNADCPWKRLRRTWE